MQTGQLRTHRQLRGWSQDDLVRELVDLGIELGERQLGVSASLISRWEHGVTQPRPPYPKLLCRLFNATAEELGLIVPSPPPSEDLQRLGLNYTSSIPDTLDAVDKLGRADIKRRVFLKTALFAVAASIGPSRDWLLATLEEAFFPNRKVTTVDVEAIRRTFGVFQELDVMRGGGHARKELASYLTSTVTPLLRSNDASTDSGRALYEAGAEQLYLVGWMAFDDGEHALAQRYLIQALRLSQEARSAALGAHVLAGLSDQATLTGHPDHGLQLARAGRAGLRHGHSPACCADLWALQARAEAALGDGKAAARSVLESQRAADAIHLPEEPEWARFIDAAYLNGEYGHAFRDLNRPGEAAAFAARSAAEAARQSRARRGSLAHATLARAALADHDLQAAAAEAASTVRLATTVRSSRSIDAVADLRQRLAPHQGSMPVADFFDLANTLLPT